MPLVAAGAIRVCVASANSQACGGIVTSVRPPRALSVFCRMPDSQAANPLEGLLGKSEVTAATGDGVDTILQAVRNHLGMDVAFVAEFRERKRDRVFRHVDAKDRTPVKPGDAVPLEQGYCQRVVDGRLPQLIVDAQALPEAASLPETRAIPIGSHLSVPIRLSDGKVYGTFCCFSFMADRSLTSRDLQMMKAFADIIADQIDRERRQALEEAEHKRRILEVMAAGQPAMVYQPIFDLNTRCVAGVESLARFQVSPQRTPDLWFAEAAKVGLGPSLEACAARSALQALQLLSADVYVAINGSPEFILSGELPSLLRDVNLHRVLLEITEHASVSDYDRLLGTLLPLRALGLRIAVDDAGAGYASMRHILSIEPDVLKLDISLTRGINQDPKRRALASALIAFAREIGSSVIAEGVETAAELRTLCALGVAKAQGYYLARPMPLSDASHVLPFADEEAGLELLQISAGT
jgi:EAL domain-containing protein (putative c-di-GMP-specific phosphodiesterase class I)